MITPEQLDISQLLPSSRKEALELGVKFYYNGFICKYGHKAKRISYNGECFECIPLKRAKHRATLKHKETTRNHYQKNKDKISKRAVHNRYGLTANDYDKLVEKQNELCAICGKPEDMQRYNSKLKLCVDHNHRTKKVRALLCHACNRGIGSFKENIFVLMNAILYLKEHE